MQSLRIDIKQFDLDNEKVTEPICLYVELAETYLLYVAEYYGEIPVAEETDDHSLGWKDVYGNFKIKVKRETLVSLDINWFEKRQVWRVECEANGYPNTISWFLKTEKEAQSVYDTLDKYIFQK